MPLSVLEEDSKIFGKNSDKPLTHYQMEINKAAFALCKEDASLLKRRNELFDKAKQKIDQEGFQYKKRHSRSKVFGQGAVDDQEVQVAKRVKLSSEVRERRIEEVQSDIATDKDTIMLLEKEKQKCASMSKFGRAAEINEQISRHQKSMRENQQILAKLQKSEARSQKYRRDSAQAKRNKREQLKKKIPKEQATITDLLSAGTSSSQSEIKIGSKQSTIKGSSTQQEVQESAIRQELDQLEAPQQMLDSENTPQGTVRQGDSEHTVAQRMPAASSASALQNAIEEDERLQGKGQDTNSQRLPTTSAASISQNAMQEIEEGLMINNCDPQGPALKKATEVIQAKSLDFQDPPQDL